MLNNFYGDYIKTKNTNQTVIKINQPTARPIIKNGHIVRNNSMINTDPKAQPIVRNGNIIRNNSIIDVKPQAHSINKSVNPYQKYFGFSFDKYKMNHTLPNASRYSGLLGESYLNIAMDVAESEHYINEGEIDKAFETGSKDKTSEFYKKFKESNAVSKVGLTDLDALDPADREAKVDEIEDKRIRKIRKAQRTNIIRVASAKAAAAAPPPTPPASPTSSSGVGTGRDAYIDTAFDSSLQKIEDERANLLYVLQQNKTQMLTSLNIHSNQKHLKI